MDLIIVWVLELSEVEARLSDWISVWGEGQKLYD